MSTRTVDPSNNRHIIDYVANNYTSILDYMRGTILTRNTFNETMVEDLFAFSIMSLGYIIHNPTRVSLLRGIASAARDLMRLSPEYQVHYDEWTPQDSNDLLQAITQHENYTKEALGKLYTDLLDLSQAKNIEWEQTKESIATSFEATKKRLQLIARTELMDTYNSATQKRYQAWGIIKYRFHAHLNCCNRPKELKDGSVAQTGCEGLHNQVYRVRDNVHRPPIHPDCRCTILPVLPEQPLKAVSSS